ncbi:hypothetical protein GO988_12975 [Hymenobacter sp. HMF4947]|uniref:O-antigen polysaccharide polymerase Wzy n=1 Tax=Hymenobacter ginkgonis TaxID=2682976 RepID=A0A7K1TGE2_9BACT|nr:hypothetical protein [Hymenobacter ginkgonis]MVN77241.1 hypothetical protein [Hymenobacter ginkgonis]
MYPSPQLPLASLAAKVGGRVRLAPTRETSFISVVTTWSWVALVIATLYQGIFFPSLPNFIAIGCTIVAWALFTTVFFKPAMLANYPLSTFLVLGFTTTQLYFPLLFTSLESKPVIYNLDLPYQVFLHSSLALITLVLSHALYRLLLQQTPNSSPWILIKLDFFKAPTELQLWLMGLIGIAATFYVFLYSPSIGWEVTGAASDKAVQALMPFSYAPFFLPFGELYGSKKPFTKRIVYLLVAYTLLLFLVSIGRNSRGGFMIGFSSVGFAYSLGLLLGVFKPNFFTMKNFFIALGAYWLFTGPIADIGTSMVIVRGQRHDVTSSELISQTFEVFGDKEAIKQFRIHDVEENEAGEWDESYLKNIFLARFCNIKFNDASLVQAEKIREYDPAMLKFSTDYIWATFPQPVLDAFGLNDVDKVFLKGVSVGDYLYYVAGGPPEALGGYRTGHFAGTGMATFGWWYLLILGVGMIPVFTLFDKFFIKFNSAASKANAIGFQFSLCGMIALDNIFRFLPSESVINIAVFLLRDWIQLALLYFVVYHFTRILSLVIPGATPPKSMKHAIG